MPRSVPRDVWPVYVERRFAGESRTQVAERLGIAYTAAARFDRGDPKSTGHDVWLDRCSGREPFRTEALRWARDNLPLGDLRIEAMEAHLVSVPVGPQCEAAEKALNDFHLFRPRYMGRRATYWQEKAANVVMELLEDDFERFLCMNLAPGLGKSTLKHDVCAWLTARNRALRGINGARGERIAGRYTAWLKRTLAATVPLPGAAAAMATDFGTFKPPTRERWRDEEFIVYQTDGQPIAEKDPTWSSFGMDSSQTGTRGDVIAWDDLVDPRKDLGPDSSQSQRDFLDGTAQTRLEFRTATRKGGLFWLLGQRLGPDDLYRYALDKKIPPKDYATFDQPVEDWPQQYVQICFKAHDEERCEGQHEESAPAWPEGCLLDPVGMSWAKLTGIKHNNERLYYIQYQQEDVDPDSVLCNPAWLNYDTNRAVWGRLPDGVKTASIISIDPSGVNYWGQQAWCYEPAGEEGLGGQRYLMDLRDRKGEAPDLLDWSFEDQCYTGLLEEWRKNFLAVGRPLKFVVVEINCAQRFLLQYAHARRWARQYGVTYIKHTTGILKTDPKLGIWSTQSHWQFGRVVLPAATAADKQMSKPLTDQVTKWPGVRREDEVMAHWFVERNLKQIVLASKHDRGEERPREWRPSWMRDDQVKGGLFAASGMR